MLWGRPSLLQRGSERRACVSFACRLEPTENARALEGLGYTKLRTRLLRRQTRPAAISWASQPFASRTTHPPPGNPLRRVAMPPERLAELLAGLEHGESAAEDASP
jgi:hypothetical protein